MGVYQQDWGDAVVGDLLIFTRGCVFEHLEQEDATVVSTQKVTRLLRRDIDSRGGHLFIRVKEGKLVSVIDVTDQDWLQV